MNINIKILEIMKKLVLAVSLVLLLIFISFMLVSPKLKKFQELLDKVNLVKI